MAKNSRKNKLLEEYSNLEYSGERVIWSKRVEKQLDRLPVNITEKFYDWINAVALMGIAQVRKRPGLHDEPLAGARQGQRSVRLNRAYRIIYIETENGEFKVIQVIEVNKHEY
ncbi:type II toxin-antitoxin system RelE family toxin [Pseudobdellovibrio sp. HCB154]|uniref:type II toxin-antitoxin system RelE family toxin n=1 Tax=Pseudobdellovibrio sp. HCB154 TaxID=3386277 RepID=UPI0039173953